ncbi:electron transport complex protein RnfG [Balneicella halophila]|uniref:Ion-translocating oxidoreductase complex subunit G n=1 Tax=Balneicella halophila TaxID=1537566 RepID=A0A7L4USR5_BALHA|nr:RnfABCDGE type electron transport complex subunit G [Balneicella halophila]PVX52572.1 electron transport complex protein RnfG [Balneicella halophila]
MAKRESNLTNMVLTLLVITLISGGVLGYVYELTKEPIAKAKLAKKVVAIKGVIPEFDNDPLKDMNSLNIEDKFTIEFYPAKVGDKQVGTAVKTYSKKGYGGPVWLMVGFANDNTITDIKVLEHTETPGLGTKMATPAFIDQFKGKNPKDFKLKVKKDGGDVDAITAATISSRAFSDAVQRAYDNLEKKGGSDE